MGRDRTAEAPALRTHLRLFGVAFVLGFSGAVMPGPLLVAVMGQTAVEGFRAVLGLVTGHALLELLTLALLAVGLRPLLRRPAVRGAIGIVGGVCLLWMSADMLRAAPSGIMDATEAGKAHTSFATLISWGALVCIANPYFLGWWATVGAGQLAHLTPRTPWEYATFYLGHEASDFLWYLCVGALVVSGRNRLDQDAHRLLIWGCGVAMGLLGFWFLWRGARAVRQPGEASS